MRIHINYLYLYTKKITQLTSELLEMQDKYEVTADLEQAEQLSAALSELKTVIDNLPLDWPPHAEPGS